MAQRREEGGEEDCLMQPVRYQAPTDGPKPVLMQREQQFPSTKFNGSSNYAAPSTPHTTIKLIINHT